MFFVFLLKLLASSFLVVFVYSFFLAVVMLPFAPLLAAAKDNKQMLVLVTIPSLICLLFYNLYFWAGWGALCALLASRYSVGSNFLLGWICWIAAFIACSFPVSFMFAKESQFKMEPSEARGTFWGAFMYMVVAVAAFFFFASWPAGAQGLYGWLLSFVV